MTIIIPKNGTLILKTILETSWGGGGGGGGSSSKCRL
jgi:hypothetical protein